MESSSRQTKERYLPHEQQTDTSSLVAELKLCGKTKDLQSGKRLHSYATRTGCCHMNSHVSSALISMYSKCRSMRTARLVFDGLPFQDVVSWTALITGYVDNGQASIALEVFSGMDSSPNGFTFSAAVKACAGLATGNISNKRMCLEKGVQIHTYAKVLGFDKDVVVSSGLVDMYSKLGDMENARAVFDGMKHRDVVCWNVVIIGYAVNGQSVQALELFDNMTCAKNHVTFVAALKACIGLTSRTQMEREICLQRGMAVHRQARELSLDKSLLVSNMLLDMYRKCGSIQRAQDAFNGMTHRDVVSWTVLILGYLESGQSQTAIRLFNRMDCTPDRLTMVAALRACSSLGALDTGQRIHDRVCELGWERDEMVANCLVDFYSKCGEMDVAEDVFNRMDSRDTVSWNALVGGYNSLGDTAKVFASVKRMQDSGVKPDSVTTLLILTAYSHAGMVDEGKSYFESMQKAGMRPTVKHYTCMVDMLGRSSRLEDALTVVRSMHCAANSVIWMTLLGACRKWGNVEIGTVAFNALVALDEDERSVAAAYVWMRNIYEKLGIQHEVQSNQRLKCSLNQELMFWDPRIWCNANIS